MNAKNSLHNCHGYILDHLVYEQIPSLPSFLVNSLFAREETSSELLRKHLNGTHDSKRTFIQKDSNVKLCRATCARNDQPLI